MDSLTRMMSVLDLISVEKPECTAAEVADALGCSRTTSYRYLKTLTDAGILASQPGGGFTLGARIIELDRQIRLSDPLLLAAEEPMHRLSVELDINAFLCSYYKNAVICIARSWLHETQYTSWDRGRPMPLLRGAAGKIILAHLPINRLRELMLMHGPEIEAHGMGSTWPQFRTNLKKIRQDGYSLTRAEVDDVSAGIAAPIFDNEGRILGSLTLAVRLDVLDQQSLESITVPLLATARQITASFQRTGPVENTG